MSENAVLIQIYSAIITYCMMAIVQKKMNIERSIYEMLLIVSISLSNTTNLIDCLLPCLLPVPSQAHQPCRPRARNHWCGRLSSC